MRDLLQVTLIGVDCIDIHRLLRAAAICQRSFHFGAVRMLTSLSHPDPRIVPISPITSREAYSSFMIKHLNTYVETPFALVIQYDGFVLNAEAWRNDYLQYDYIGAPWYMPEGHTVGNGGFSLRSKRLLARLQQDQTIVDPHDFEPSDVAEDWYICVLMRSYLEERGIRFAPVELAKQFSLEGNERDGVTWTSQFGFHGLQWTDISSWLQRHPDERIDNTLDDDTRALKARLGA